MYKLEQIEEKIDRVLEIVENIQSSTVKDHNKV